MQEYLQNKQYFADLFNGCFFHGRPVICASELTEASEGYVVDQDDTITSEKPLAAVKVKKGGNEDCFQCSGDRTLDQATVSDAAGTEIQIEKSRPRPGRRKNTKTKLMRDVKMQLRSGTVLQVLAVENQSYINYGMPVRIMGYDAAEYNRQMKEHRQQVSALWKQVESSGQYDTLAIPVTYAEYMSGILKTDRLHPVYTICLYSGTETWDGPRTLSDMMEFRAETDPLKEYFSDYPANLFCVNEQKEFEHGTNDLAVFTSASTVKGFVESTKGLDYSRVRAACIGKQTRAAADSYGMQTYMSEKATIDSLIELVETLKRSEEKWN